MGSADEKYDKAGTGGKCPSALRIRSYSPLSDRAKYILPGLGSVLISLIRAPQEVVVHLVPGGLGSEEVMWA